MCGEKLPNPAFLNTWMIVYEKGSSHFSNNTFFLSSKEKALIEKGVTVQP